MQSHAREHALVHALAVEPSENRAAGLGTIAEAQAAAGNVGAALRIAQLIPSDQASRIAALRSIAGAQARLGMASEAKETFTQAHQLAEARANQLGRAEVLYSLAQAEAEAGMAAEATNTFVAFAAVLGSSANAMAQIYLSRPITLIVPGPAGESADSVRSKSALVAGQELALRSVRERQALASFRRCSFRIL